MRDFLDWCREQRDEMLRSVEMFETGTLTLREKSLTTGRDTDISAQHVDHLKRAIAELDAILSQHGQSN